MKVPKITEHTKSMIYILKLFYPEFKIEIQEGSSYSAIIEIEGYFKKKYFYGCKRL